MSVDIEDQFTMDQADETKKPKASYSREFLLSLRELDICKNLPSGFDESLLCEFEDASQDRQRISGDLSSHGFRRSDYSSSPPIRGDFAGYTRGSHGRWDSRSNGRSDKDIDSHSDRDSESAKRFGNQVRKPWQAPEHDGLLGKGSFTRQSGNTASVSGPRFQSNDSVQLSKSNEPYQPPRPYKAISHARKDVKDTFNDETFGSSDSTNGGRVEEERKRRESFELLRREQHKSFQERQRSNPEVRKEGFDFSELLGNSKDEIEHPIKRKEAEEATALPGSSNTTLSSQSSTPRPLVPPGFATATLERKSGPKASVDNSQFESVEGGLLRSKGDHLLNGASGTQLEEQPENQTSSNVHKFESTGLHVHAADTSGMTLNLSSVLGIPSDAQSINNGQEKLSGLSVVTGVPEPAEITGLTIKKLEQKTTVGNFNQQPSPTILDKLFNSTFNGGDSSSLIKHNDSKGEEALDPQTVASSKFAHLFLEEEKRPKDVLSSSRPCDLLSLIQGVDSSQTSESNATDRQSLSFPFQSRETKHLDQLSGINTSRAPVGPPVLTCEDLEQSILSEACEKDSPSPLAGQEWNVIGLRAEQQKTKVDDRASQHLLSLLQKSPKENDTGLPPNLVPNQFEKQPKQGEDLFKEEKTGNSGNSKNSLTLEALFGSAFMKELQSVGDPVSGRLEVSDLESSVGSNMSSSKLSQRDQFNINGLTEPLFGSDERQTGRNSRISDFDGSSNVQFSGDNSLSTFGDPVNHHRTVPFRGSHKQEPDMSFDITEKLAALSSVMRNERPSTGEKDGHFLRHPPNNFDPEMLFRRSSVQGSPHLNNSGTMFPSFDSPHMKSQINLLPPGNMIHHDPSHQFPPNINRPFHHPGGGIPEFERIPPAMLHQMHMQGSLPPPHMLQGFPGSLQHPVHLDNQLRGVGPDTIPAQGAPFGHRRPNYAGHVMPPVHDNRSEHPASLHRLLGLEPQLFPHQAPAGPRRQGSYGS